MGNNVVPFRRRHAECPTTGGGTPPLRVPNRRRRSREHLTAAEVARLIDAARAAGRHGQRDAALILVAYRHGLRVSELVGLCWDQVDFERGTLHVNRIKRGDAATHPLAAVEVTALRELRTSNPESARIFVSERGGPLTAASVRKIVARSGQVARLEFSVHPHLLRHATGYYLANNGVDTRTIQAYLGHHAHRTLHAARRRSLQSAVARPLTALIPRCPT